MENFSPQQLIEEKQKLEQLKAELEKKNKEMWAVSESVYKEKKKVDEQLKEMLEEKTRLELLKKENAEKVKMLWEQSTAIHKEKERINELKIDIEHKHKEIMDSVTYAKRIQSAILPTIEEIDLGFPKSFVLFKPKDIVAGDFYWYYKPDHEEGSPKGNLLIAAADCTGHGVPGAFMSMLGTDKLNQAVLHSEDVSRILQLINMGMKKAMRQSDREDSTRDGMDIAICSFNSEMTMLEYAAANRPLWIVRKNAEEIEEIKATKIAIGGLTPDSQEFTKHKIELKKGDKVYLFSDGYADQFGKNNKKLMTKSFKNNLLIIQTKTMKEQRELLDNFIEEWKGDFEQTDDILIIGIEC